MSGINDAEGTGAVKRQPRQLSPMSTKHSAGEYARRESDVVVHSNTIEGVFSVFKRGMVGVYQHCGEAHLHRYLAEFDFRYNRRAVLGFTDAERADELLAWHRWQAPDLSADW